MSSLHRNYEKFPPDHIAGYPLPADTGAHIHSPAPLPFLFALSVGIYSPPLQSLSNYHLKIATCTSNKDRQHRMLQTTFIPIPHPQMLLLSQSSPFQLGMPPRPLLLRTETEEGVLIHSPVFSSQKSFFQSDSASHPPHLSPL